jgi:small subunit ribosomal protein S20
VPLVGLARRFFFLSAGGRTFVREMLHQLVDLPADAEDRELAVKMLDRSARKGLIHKNAAARQKSRMAKAAKKAKA